MPGGPTEATNAAKRRLPRRIPLCCGCPWVWFLYFNNPGQRSFGNACRYPIHVHRERCPCQRRRNSRESVGSDSRVTHAHGSYPVDQPGQRLFCACTGCYSVPDSGEPAGQRPGGGPYSARRHRAVHGLRRPGQPAESGGFALHRVGHARSWRRPADQSVRDHRSGAGRPIHSPGPRCGPTRHPNTDHQHCHVDTSPPPAVRGLRVRGHSGAGGPGRRRCRRGRIRGHPRGPHRGAHHHRRIPGRGHRVRPDPGDHGRRRRGVQRRTGAVHRRHPDRRGRHRRRDSEPARGRLRRPHQWAGAGHLPDPDRRRSAYCDPGGSNRGRSNSGRSNSGRSNRGRNDCSGCGVGADSGDH